MNKNAFGCFMVLALSSVLAGCDPLVAPIASTISINAEITVLRPGESTPITAWVTEEAGTPVHDGTVVKFFGTLGVVDPPEVKTKNGVAQATFTAGNVLGVGNVVATSGAAESGPEIPNTVDIEITQG